MNFQRSMQRQQLDQTAVSSLVNTKILQDTVQFQQDESRYANDQLQAAYRQINDLKLQNETLINQVQSFSQSKNINESHVLTSQIEINRRAQDIQNENFRLKQEIKQYIQSLGAATQQIKELQRLSYKEDQQSVINHLQAELILKQQTIETLNSKLLLKQNEAHDLQQQINNISESSYQQAQSQRVSLDQLEMIVNKTANEKQDQIQKIQDLESKLTILTQEKQVSAQELQRTQQVTQQLQLEKQQKDSTIVDFMQKLSQKENEFQQVEQQKQQLVTQQTQVTGQENYKLKQYLIESIELSTCLLQFRDMKEQIRNGKQKGRQQQNVQIALKHVDINSQTSLV